jgi:hypothetical protein
VHNSVAGSQWAGAGGARTRALRVQLSPRAAGVGRREEAAMAASPGRRDPPGTVERADVGKSAGWKPRGEGTPGAPAVACDVDAREVATRDQPPGARPRDCGRRRLRERIARVAGERDSANRAEPPRSASVGGRVEGDRRSRAGEQRDRQHAARANERRQPVESLRVPVASGERHRLPGPRPAAVARREKRLPITEIAAREPAVAQGAEADLTRKGKWTRSRPASTAVGRPPELRPAGDELHVD